MNIEIANHLVQLRKKNGLSQEALADKLGISRQAVSKWERAEASPDTDNLIALAKLYNVSLNELLLMQEENSNEKDGKKQEKEETAEASEENGSRPDENGSSPEENDDAAKNKTKVNIGKDGIHITDGDDYVHVDCKGVHIHDKHDEVHIGKGHVIVNGDDYDSRSQWHKRWKEFPFSVVVCIAYLLMGFLGSLWHPGWLIFLTIPLFHSVITCVYKRSAHYFAYPVFAALAFLTLGFLVPGAWAWSWVLFLSIPVFYFIFKKPQSKPGVFVDFESDDDDDDDDDDD